MIKLFCKLVFSIVMMCVAAGLLTDWTGPDVIAASEMLATADRYRREGTSRGHGAAQILYGELRRRYPETYAAHLAWIKLNIFYTCNPWYEPERPGCRYIPAGK